MSKLTKALTAAAGNAGGGALYAEDVFSTYLYTGNSSTQTITNDIDLAGEGGLVWLKKRNGASNNIVSDTERGITNTLNTDGANAQNTITSTAVSSVQSDGFTLQNNGDTNQTGGTYASWTFRKAEKFFDVVTYTGDGTAQNITHNLGSTPAVIFVKQTSSTSNWSVYHSSLGATQVIFLNLTNGAFTSGIDNWNSTAPTDSQFSVGPSTATNTSGETYVAYLFASDAGGFGDDGSESIIKCGEFSVDGSYEADVECGFEPQWVLIKPAEDSGSWLLFDTMRGAPVGGDAAWLAPDLSQQEAFTANRFNPTATGFHIGNYGITAGNKIIYIAIRRPMKTPESGTEVFSPNIWTGDGSPEVITTGFSPDVSLGINRGAVHASTYLSSRLTGMGSYLSTTTTAAENSDTASVLSMDGITINSGNLTSGFGGGQTYVGEFFKRATGFFDVVAYTGTGVATTQAHNLGVAPELMIVKRRNGTGQWSVYHSELGGGYYLRIAPYGTDAAAPNTQFWNNTDPTSSVFSVGSSSDTNGSSNTYISYLFATLAGVSKVGSYTGTAADLNVDCGFSAGARFILIKRTDSTGDWYVYDSERGIVAGNDPYLLLNSTAAEVTSTDYIDPLSSGFTVTSSAPAALNASGGTYIFLAIA